MFFSRFFHLIFSRATYVRTARERKKPVSFEDTGFPIGRSGGSRTHGLMDPNHARYQLRYAPI